MNIRKANPVDVPRIMKLWKDFMKEHSTFIADPRVKESIKFKDNAPEIFEKIIKKEVMSKNAAIFVAENGQKILGFAKVNIRDNFPIFKYDKIGCITDLYVENKSRKMEISSALMNNAVRWAKGNGARYASIQLFRENRSALSIYKKWGFFESHMEMNKKL